MLVNFDTYSGLILLSLHSNTSCLLLLKIAFDKVTLFRFYCFILKVVSHEKILRLGVSY